LVVHGPLTEGNIILGWVQEYVVLGVLHAHNPATSNIEKVQNEVWRSSRISTTSSVYQHTVLP
jgi:hypothetical protein